MIISQRALLVTIILLREDICNESGILPVRSELQLFQLIRDILHIERRTIRGYNQGILFSMAIG